ncbi:hypothetical protein LA080_001987 [Diaporthe eres]|nr:hypothetical protein LA080_001987 [Diaporthe eres]
MTENPAFRLLDGAPTEEENDMTHIFEKTELCLSSAITTTLGITNDEKAEALSEFSNQICALREQRVYLLSDSTEAVKHARRDTLARRPGPVLGIDTDSADQWCLQIEQQREHLRDDIYTLPQARERFSRQADELDEEIQTIRRTVAEVHAESKRLKKGMEKAQNQQ